MARVYIKHFDNINDGIGNNTLKSIYTKIGFKEVNQSRANIVIRFRKGATVRNWETGKSRVAWKVAAWNIHGNGRAQARPFFTDYIYLNRSRISSIVKETIKGGGNMEDAGEAIKEDLIRWVSKGVYQNPTGRTPEGHPRYGDRKMARFGHTDALYTSKGQLFSALEVALS